MLESFNQRKLFFKFYILWFNMLMSWSWNIFWFPFGIVRAFIQIWYVLWPPPLCNFISLSLKRWIFSRQSPRPFSCSHPFRRLRDIYRKLSRKTDQKTLPPLFVELVIKFVMVIGWTLDPLPIILLLCKNIVQQYLIVAV